jgi:serine/threonine protein kinase
MILFCKCMAMISGGSYGKVFKEKGGMCRKEYDYKYYSSHGFSDDALKEIVAYSLNDMLTKITVDSSGCVSLHMKYKGRDLSSVKNTDVNGMYNILYQVLKILDFNEKLGIIHRDIKPQNIVFQDGVAHLIDYGISSFGPPNLSREVYTIWYRPPEIILGREYSIKADVWALAATIIETIIKDPLIPTSSTTRRDELAHLGIALASVHLDDYTDSMVKLLSVSAYKYYKKLNKVRDFSPELFTLLERMLRFNPDERPSPSEALEMFLHFNYNCTKEHVYVKPILNKLTVPGDFQNIVQRHTDCLLSTRTAVRAKWHQRDSKPDVFYIVLANSLYMHFSFLHPVGEAQIKAFIILSLKLFADEYEFESDTLHLQKEELKIIDALPRYTSIFLHGLNVETAKSLLQDSVNWLSVQS